MAGRNIVPIYQCISPVGLVTDDARTLIATEITRIHCSATGAPPAFVNVLFVDMPDGNYFTAGLPSTHSLVVGEIRCGRDIATRQALLRDLSQMWTRLTGQSDTELVVALKEIAAENAMEAGLILPAPGDESQWFEENRAKLGNP
jgi:phenylpyruvate tautomerase PptA (4-oxalocrotonate tautomerase family)